MTTKPSCTDTFYHLLSFNFSIGFNSYCGIKILLFILLAREVWAPKHMLKKKREILKTHVHWTRGCLYWRLINLNCPFSSTIRLWCAVQGCDKPAHCSSHNVKFKPFWLCEVQVWPEPDCCYHSARDLHLSNWSMCCMLFITTWRLGDVLGHSSL